MRGIFKRLTAFAVAALTLLTMGMSVAAEKADYQLDTSKAKKTMGGGQAFVYYLRNTNEVRKHGKQLDNAWITPESEIIIKYEYMGEIPQEKKDKGIDYPATLVLQCWTGELVDAEESRWVELVPTTFSEEEATFSYADMVAQWPEDDLSDVYAFVVVDEGVSLTVNDMIITNLDIPEDAEYKGLTLLSDTTAEVTETETTVSETQSVESDKADDSEGVADGEVVTDGEENATDIGSSY